MTRLPDIGELQALVRETARREIMTRFLRVGRAYKDDGSIVTEADHAMQAALGEQLAHRWPGFGFLGEESTESDQRQALKAPHGCWCLDPLDGTTNFSMGLPFFCTSLALLKDGRPELGVVYDPVRDECFAARRGHGATLNGSALGGADELVCGIRGIACVDFKRLNPSLAQRIVRDQPFASQRNLGASALEWCWLADGRFHLLLHGGEKPWDFSAGLLVLSEAGGHATTFEGAEIVVREIGSCSVVAARDPHLQTAFRAWIASAEAKSTA